MLRAVESIFLEHGRERSFAGLLFRPRFRKHDIEERLHHAAQFRSGAAGRAEPVEFRTAQWRKRPHFLPEEPWYGERIISFGHETGIARQQCGEGSVFVDGEIVDDWFHGEGQGSRQFLLEARHDRLKELLGFRLAAWCHHEAHAAAGHASEHPEAVEVTAQRRLGALDELFRIVCGSPGNDGLNRTLEVPRGGRSDSLDVALLEAAGDFVQQAEGVLTCLPFRGGAQQVFLCHHFENRPDVLGHASMDEHEAVLEQLTR